MASDSDPQIPAIPVSAGALIFDRDGRLLILKPTYKSGWTIPGGVMEANGETPWQACQREVAEECGIDVRSGKLACVDFRPPRPGKPGGVRFLFDCGPVSDGRLAAIVLQLEEIWSSQPPPTATSACAPSWAITVPCRTTCQPTSSTTTTSAASPTAAASASDNGTCVMAVISEP